MVSRTWIRRESDKTKVTEEYRGQEIVERQDCTQSEGTGHKKIRRRTTTTTTIRTRTRAR